MVRRVRVEPQPDHECDGIGEPGKREFPADRIPSRAQPGVDPSRVFA